MLRTDRPRRFGSWCLYLTLALLLSTVLATQMWAQGSGELTGLVTDPQGAAVPKVQVTLTNNSTGAEKKTETTAAGIYHFSALTVVGSYTLTAQPKNYKAVKVTDIVVSVGTTVTRDIKLQLGRVDEVINVEATAPTVQTTDSSVSTLVDRRVWQNMPLEVRNANKFVELLPGVVGNDFANEAANRGAAVNGARPGSGNFMVEGTDNNDQGQGGRGQLSNDPGGSATSISPDAIQEYRVITNTFPAEYGKAGGFVTDTVLKSGTNQWHGSLYEYNRMQALAANSFFSNATEDPNNPGHSLKDRLVRNQFGGSVGGPIIKDKTFFYTSFEMHRMRQSTPLQGTGTTQQFLDFVNSGAFQTWAETDPGGLCMQYNGVACPGAFAGVSTLGPTFQALKTKYGFPLATFGFSNKAKGWYTDGLTYPVPVYGSFYVEDPYKLNENRFTMKVDHRLGSKDQLSGTYLLQDAERRDQFGGSDTSVGAPYFDEGRAQNAALTWNHTFSPTVLNTFKASFLRHTDNYPQLAGFAGTPSIVTAVDPVTVGFGQSSAQPQFFTDNQFQFLDTLSLVRGKHNFKAGFEYRRTRNGSSFEASKNGFFLPYGIEDLVTDMKFGDLADLAVFGAPVYGSLYYGEASLNPATGGPPVYYRGYRASEFAAFFQDDWRVSRRLTLNLGVRWEYFGPPHNFDPTLDSNFYFGTPTTPMVSSNPFFPKNSGFYSSVKNGAFGHHDVIWNQDTNNFGPRVGFAFDVFGNQKLVMRGGAGIMYDRIWNNLFENIRFNPPAFAFDDVGTLANGVPSGFYSTPGLYTYPFTSLAAFTVFNSKPSARHMDQNLVSPYYEQVHFGLQYEIAPGYVVESEYIGTWGKKLTGVSDINTFDGRRAGLGSSSRINTAMSGDNYRSNFAGSTYHAWQTTLRKNYSKGVSFNASYTWSRAMDNISDAFENKAGGGGGYRPSDNMNPNWDWGPADFQMKHRFVASVTYDLPFFKQNRWLGGWGINSILSLQSGTPFTPYNLNNDLNKDGYYTDRIVYTGTGVPQGSIGSAGQFDPGVGGVPYVNVGQWGNYTCPVSVNLGLWCNAPIGRNSVTGPGFKNIDMGVSKKFKASERVSVTAAANFFNILNHTNFKNPDTNRGSPTFGYLISAHSPRITQLAVRLDF